MPERTRMWGRVNALVVLGAFLLPWDHPYGGDPFLGIEMLGWAALIAFWGLNEPRVIFGGRSDALTTSDWWFGLLIIATCLSAICHSLRTVMSPKPDPPLPGATSGAGAGAQRRLLGWRLVLTLAVLGFVWLSRWLESASWGLWVLWAGLMSSVAREVRLHRST